VSGSAIEDYSHIVIGGGVYGCYLALKLVEIEADARVLLVERENDILLRASYNNQARIHNGYHYPRSLLTALRSRINFPRFNQEFSECVVKNFAKVYAIGKQRSNVTSSQFYQFCRRIGAPIQPAPEHLTKWFNQDLIEQVFLVTEYAFDACKLRKSLKERLLESDVRMVLNAEAIEVMSQQQGTRKARLRLLVKNVETNEKQTFGSRYIYNCTYANLNSLLARSGLAKLYLRHEATEIALLRVPEFLANMGVTVMCGPFFSLMPFPAKGLLSLSHVSYTPHYEWAEIPSDNAFAQHSPKFPLTSNSERMVQDAMRYLPVLSGCSYVESLWEVKTILPQSDESDSRPILFKEDSATPGFISILGSKIDNIFDLDEPLRSMVGDHPGSGSCQDCNIALR
jgi:glycine/D-amino acid oxidase-like deaminating enzyme